MQSQIECWIFLRDCCHRYPVLVAFVGFENFRLSLWMIEAILFVCALWLCTNASGFIHIPTATTEWFQSYRHFRMQYASVYVYGWACANIQFDSMQNCEVLASSNHSQVGALNCVTRWLYDVVMRNENQQIFRFTCYSLYHINASACEWIFSSFFDSFVCT